MARKILLADDSVTAQNMGRKILTDAGYDVVTVNNGSAALKRVAEVKPDLIVLDVYMPGYSGLEVCQRLKDAGETSHIPVLLTVGKLEPFKPEEGRRVRADSHIVKPFEASELLTAITKLEDRMAPQSSGANRSANKAAEHNGDPDTGWKNRLSFSKKKKEEAEPNPEETSPSASFRDFRKAKGKTNGSAITKTATPTPAEPVTVADVPRDITPEEMDALSALASKLDGEIPAAEAAAKPEVAKPEVPKTAAAEAQKVETPAPIVESAVAAEPTALAVEHRVIEAAAAKSDVEIPVACLEPEESVATPALVEMETAQPQSQHSDTDSAEAGSETLTPDIPVVFEVSTSLLAQEPAPVDRNDEPTFASFLGPVEPRVEEPRAEQKIAEEKIAEEKIEEKPAEAVASGEKAEEIVTAPLPEAQSGESSPGTTLAPTASPLAEAVEAAPSDAELVEALRLLTPAIACADITAAPAPQSLAAAGQLLAEEAMRDAAAGPRWVAQPVTLSPEEAAISLEAEMLLTLAAAPAASNIAEDDARRITGVSAITAAVDHRLAAADSTAITHSSQNADEHVSAESQTESQTDLPIKTEAPENSTEAMPAMIAAGSDSMNPQQSEAAATTLASSDAPQPGLVQHGADAALKAMAAAAAAESSSSATDASTIASIVDSVMADLRPKIVEEIAKKLARKD